MLQAMSTLDRLNAAYPPTPIIWRTTQVSISDILTRPPDPQNFAIEGILPNGVVTLLGAHGGTGKSMLALIAMTCLAMGVQFMGKVTKKSKVIFYSAEDPAQVIRRRLFRICKSMDIHPREIAANVLILDATDNPTLYNNTKTPAFDALSLDAKQFKPDVIIIDNASDTFDSNEIERARVREFVRLLASLSKPSNAAILLLAHIDKQTARGNGGSEGYSGSTAWHNSARSRLFLSESDGVLILEHQKSNFGLRSEPIHMRWTDSGLLEQINTPGGSNDRQIILGLIGEFYMRGIFISPAQNSPSNPHKVLRNSTDFPRGLSRQGLMTIINELQVTGFIQIESYSTGHRNTRQRYALSAVSHA
jgi:archaellum biogenesis ATPase FlaH